MNKSGVASIRRSYFDHSKVETQNTDQEIKTHILANISLVAFLNIIGRFSDYQNPSLDESDPNYKNELIRSIFGLNIEDEKNISPEFFQMLSKLSEAEDIGKREIENTGVKQNGNLPQFFSDQLTANCIDAVCPLSIVGKFGLGLKTTFGMLTRLPFGSQAVMHGHKDKVDYIFSIIQTGKTDSNSKSQLIASLNNTQIEYYLNQTKTKNKVPDVWKSDTADQNGTKITLISSGSIPRRLRRSFPYASLKLV